MKQISDFNFLPYGYHFIDEEDEKAVIASLRSGSLTQGSGVSNFEHNFAKSVGSKYAVAVSSATAGLHISCLAAGLGPGSLALTSSNTFVATPNAVLYTGAKPVFLDIDLTSLNMDLEKVAAYLRKTKVDAVLPVHFAGVAFGMQYLKSLAEENKFTIIEDAAHALGATYETGELVGSCKYSDMTVFSLHPVKGVTAGEGGVVTTNSEKLYRSLLQYRSHGICKGNFMFPGISDKNSDVLKNISEAFDEDNELKPWYYEMQNLGFNYRITDFQCALANSQLSKLNAFKKRRKQIAERYDAFFGNSKIIQTYQSSFRDISSFHLYVVSIDFAGLNISRSKFMNKLREQNIGSQVHYIPPPMQPYYRENLKTNMKDFPTVFQYYNKCLSIPMYFGLTDRQIDFVSQTIEKVLFELSKE